MENSTDNISNVETEICNCFLKNYMSILILMPAACFKEVGTVTTKRVKISLHSSDDITYTSQLKILQYTPIIKSQRVRKMTRF